MTRSSHNGSCFYLNGVLPAPAAGHVKSAPVPRQLMPVLLSWCVWHPPGIPYRPVSQCHHAVPWHFWPFLDNVHWVCKYYGGGGLVAKSCLAVATPWTVACQAPRWNLRISDWATLCLQQEGFISQTSNNTVSRSKKPSAHKMWKSKKGSVLWNLKDS